MQRPHAAVHLTAVGASMASGMVARGVLAVRWGSIRAPGTLTFRDPITVSTGAVQLRCDSARPQYWVPLGCA